MKKESFLTFGEDGTKKNCWLEFRDCKKNQYIESIVDEYFQDLIFSTRKKKSYRLALAYLLTTIFRLLRRVETDEKYTWILWQDSYWNEEIDKKGFKYRFSWSKKYPRKDEQLYRKDYYLYGAERIRKDFLFKIFKLLEQRDIVRRGKKGYSILPRNSYSLAFIYINWRKVYNDIYLINKDNYIKSSPKLDGDTERQPIVIRTQDDKGKYTNLITKEKLKSISRRQEIKETKTYLERLTELYNSMDLSLSYFEQGTIPQREEVINQWLLKDKGYFCKDTFNHNVDILNIYLQSNWSPYRLYHLTDNKLSLGRIYGGPLDTKVSNIYKPLLKINDTYTI